MEDSDIKAWLNGAQQLFDGPQDISEETPTTTGGLSDGSMAFFVGKPKTDGSGEWILKKVTPGNLNKMVFNYLTQSNIASQLASVLGGLKIGVPLADANEYAGSNVITFRPAMAVGSFYNYPEGSTGRLIILNMFDGHNNSQVCVIIGVDKIHTRTTTSGIWGDWE